MLIVKDLFEYMYIMYLEGYIYKYMCVSKATFIRKIPYPLPPKHYHTHNIALSPLNSTYPQQRATPPLNTTLTHNIALPPKPKHYPTHNTAPPPEPYS